ncbi:hypothetical protein [Schlesneria sp. T3-172]|uniref:hypothetical protein n=1 Tax=Schlesneria sphaerica TaxID=3373610 RepID=UPI0037CA7720
MDLTLKGFPYLSGKHGCVPKAKGSFLFDDWKTTRLSSSSTGDGDGSASISANAIGLKIQGVDHRKDA